MTLAETHRQRRHVIGTSTIRKRSIVIAAHKTSISLEDKFWNGLRALATERDLTLSALVGEIDEQRPANANLASAIRVAVLAHALTRLDTMVKLTAGAF
jgi:predicted DNA-binding ribbon-helix-helix protein